MNGGTLKDSGTLDGACSEDYGVNDGGQVVGYLYTTGIAATHAFLYSGGVMTDLNTLIAPGSSFTLNGATGISDTDYGTTVGAGTADTFAFLLTPNALAAVLEASTTVPLGLLLALGLGGVVLSRRRGPG